MKPIRQILIRSAPTSLRLALPAALALAAASGAALAGPAPFDLDGPKLQVSVTRAGKTLPISQTPSLAEGDRLSIKANLPKSQSTHYLLVAGFLRGVTNPPPDKWFSQSQTWSAKAKDGLTVTVPAGAQQMLLFMAPATGGDFKTLVNTVRDRPGAFVRASQDLNQASLDHARLEAFLAAVRAINQTRPGQLKTISPLLARSLTIKLDSACLRQTTELQASCLTQGQDSLVLNDGHSTSMVQALTSGYSAELVQQLSTTPKAGGGYYSPYVASVLDIARIMDSFHTAQFQYIPALEAQAGDRLSLLLNAAPSFQNPKSVLVVALPGVEPAQPPPLHAIEADSGACLQKPGLVLPVEGAPLVFSTGYAHDLVLRLKGKDGQTFDAPLTADAEKGGLVVDASQLDPANFGDTVEGQIQGYWGFDPYSGPTIRLQSARPQTWRVDAEDEQALIAGRDGVVHLQAKASGCVQSVTLQPASGEAKPIEWKASGPDTLLIKASLKDAQPGPMTLVVREYGAGAPNAAPVTVYAAASRLEAFAFHAGERSGVLKGADLDQVAQLDLAGVVFRPAASADGGVGLTLTAADGDAVSKLKTGQSAKARVKLKDGRIVTLATTVAAARPAVSLIAKSLRPQAPDGGIKVALGNPDELPHNAQLTFSIHAQGATSFSGAETVEVATAQGGFSTVLSAANDDFTLQNAQVAVAMLDLGKAFGSSAFGPLRFRVVGPTGASDWQPLGVLVRLPILHELNCEAAADQPQPCQLNGSDLFLIDSVSSDPGFTHPVQVPSGFPGNTLQAPEPKDGQLYVKLSDNPGVINVVTLPPDAKAASNAAAPAATPGKS